MSDRRLSALDYAEILALAVLWGASYLLMRAAVPQFGPAGVVFARLLIALAVLLPILLWRKGLAELLAHWRILILLGIISNAIPYMLLAFAAQSIPAGMSAILNSTMPLFGALIGYYAFGESLTRLRVLGLVVGVLGVTVLVWGKLRFDGDGSGPAILAVLAGALTWAYAGPFTRVKMSGANALTTTVGTMIVGLVVLSPLAWWTMPAQMPDTRAWLEVLTLGLLSTAIGTLLYFRILARAGTVAAMSVMFLNPITAMLTSAAYLGEAITAQMFAGCVIVLFGTALSVGIIGGYRRA